MIRTETVDEYLARGGRIRHPIGIKGSICPYDYNRVPDRLKEKFISRYLDCNDLEINRDNLVMAYIYYKDPIFFDKLESWNTDNVLSKWKGQIPKWLTKYLK